MIITHFQRRQNVGPVRVLAKCRARSRAKIIPIIKIILVFFELLSVRVPRA